MFKLSLRQCRKDKDRIQADRLANQFLTKSSKFFWNEIKRINGNKTTLSTNIEHVLGEKPIADLWGSHFKNLLNLPDMKYRVDHISDVHNQESVHFSVSEVYNAITNLKKGKSGGCNGISLEHFLYAHCNVTVLSPYCSMLVSHTIIYQLTLRKL